MGVIAAHRRCGRHRRYIDEFLRGPASRLGGADTDADGVVSLRELAGMRRTASRMTLDWQHEERQRQQAVETRRTEQQLQLDFERQRALQQEQTRIEIEEQRQFEQWRRQQGV